jgi:hypothetical protein
VPRTAHVGIDGDDRLRIANLVCQRLEVCEILGSLVGNCEERYFWNVMPCSVVEVYRPLQVEGTIWRNSDRHLSQPVSVYQNYFMAVC